MNSKIGRSTKLLPWHRDLLTCALPITRPLYGIPPTDSFLNLGKDDVEPASYPALRTKALDRVLTVGNEHIQEAVEELGEIDGRSEEPSVAATRTCSQRRLRLSSRR